MTPSNDDVTLGELGRRMDALHQDVKELRSAVVEHDDLRAVTLGWEKALQAHEMLAFQRLGSVETRVDSLEQWKTWALRIVVGAVLMALLGTVLVNNGVTLT